MNKILLIVILIFTVSCKRNENQKIDLSKITFTKTSSFRTHNFENLKNIRYKTNGNKLKNEILNIWESERIFIGEEITEKNKNLTLTLEKVRNLETLNEKKSRIESVKNKLIENIINVTDYDNIIIKYSMITDIDESIESTKSFKTK